MWQTTLIPKAVCSGKAERQFGHWKLMVGRLLTFGIRGLRTSWAMKKIPGCFGYKGLEDCTQLYGDYMGMKTSHLMTRITHSTTNMMESNRVVFVARKALLKPYFWGGYVRGGRLTSHDRRFAGSCKDGHHFSHQYPMNSVPEHPDHPWINIDKLS